MLRISKLADYATRIVSVLAIDWQARLSASDLAAACQLPAPTVSKILKILVHANILSSVRGVDGGYTLTRPPAEISLSQLIQAMEGPVALTECNLSEGSCEHEHHCQLIGNWQSVNRVIDHFLAEISLAEFLTGVSDQAVIERVRANLLSPQSDRSGQPVHFYKEQTAGEINGK